MAARSAPRASDMASNDPTDTGGLFIGRRPGTAPVRWRHDIEAPSERRRRAGNILAAGHHQERGALERIFTMSVAVAVVAFTFWFLIIQGPGPTFAPSS